MTGFRLAVVIPAYRGEFLSEMLNSLAAQTRRDFQVLVADDASPDDIQGIVARAQTRGLDVLYKRFECNLGSSCLTAHWDRAVRLTNEPWILLPGDDDLLDPRLVEAFYDALVRTDEAFDVYRFNTRTIDSAGALVLESPDHPEWEGPLAFVRSRIHRERASFTCEYVFRRTAWDRLAGFVHFPLAWCSDDATWVALSSRNGIFSIAGPRASWRLSGRNISSTNRATELDKLRASCQYLAWLARNLPRACDWDPAVAAQLRLDAALWLNLRLWQSGIFVPIADGFAMSAAASRFTRLGAFWHFLRIAKHDSKWLMDQVRLRARRSGNVG